MNGWILFVTALVALAFYAFRNKTAKSKGAAGERTVMRALNAQLRRGMKGCLLQNVYLPREDGGTSEADVVLLSTKGIFVIESKNFAGYVFGDEQQPYWTVSLYAGKNWLGQKKTEKHRFYNPVWQNKTHIKYLRRIVSPNIPIFSVVVFSDRCKLMNVSYASDKVEILQTTQLKSYFTNVRTSWPDVLSETVVEKTYKQLVPYSQADREIQTRHIEYITELKNNPKVCPWCGGQLVMRTARKGNNAGQKFFGCSNYPKCKYTRSI